MKQNDETPDLRDLEQLESDFKQDFSSQYKKSYASKVSGATVLGRLKRRTQMRVAMSLAAMMLITFGIWGLIGQNANLVLDQKLQRSLVWLKREQLPEGSWDAVKWGGKERFTVGISSLAMMSILQVEGVSAANVVNHTLEYLKAQQSESGLFGPEFLGDLYNHCLATLALKKAKGMGFQIDDEVIEKAELHLEKFRTQEGYFAYREGMRAEKNLTEWATLALNGCDHYDLNWSYESTHQSVTHSEAVTSNYRMDAMELFFRQLLNPKVTQEIDHLIERQEEKGDLAGSWPVEGKWSHVGGRVFTTGMAVLCMKPLTI